MRIQINKMVLSAIAMLILIATSSEAAPGSAYESVQGSTDILLARLTEVQPIYESDPEQFFSEVGDALDPYIDFDGFSKRVMAKHYRKATAEQQQSFKRKFSDGLVRTYATALLEFDNQKVVVQEPARPQKRPDRATIQLEVHAKSGAIYPVHYQLGLDGDRWLLRNVIINGINMGLQFHSQFNAYMQKYKGDINQVIDNWAVDVES